MSKRHGTKDKKDKINDRKHSVGLVHTTCLFQGKKLLLKLLLFTPIICLSVSSSEMGDKIHIKSHTLILTKILGLYSVIPCTGVLYIAFS